MICFNCKTQIPDNSQVCPNCGAPQAGNPQTAQNPQAQIAQAQMQTQAAHARTYKAIKLRRVQRWIFYVIIIIIFVAMIGYMLKIYSDNTKLVESITQTQTQLKETQGNLDSTRQTLTGKDSELTQLKQSTLDNQNALNLKMQDLQKTLNGQTDSLKQLEQYKGQAMSATQVFSMISQVSSFMSSKDLSRIPVADFNLASGNDGDKDGLSDDLEASLGTNSLKSDTDGDTFADKAEFLGGYDPLASGKKLATDLKFAQANKGKIVIQNDNGNGSFIWYINLKDGKRYFIGRLPDGVVSAYVPMTASTTSTSSSSAR
ncbi:MAG: hypothetical protein WC244_03685 [Patescibacteria group bacterium]|jgi:hypothetical protein